MFQFGFNLHFHMMNDGEHLLMYLSAIYTSSAVICMLWISCPLSVVLFVCFFIIELLEFFIYKSGQKYFIRQVSCKYFLPMCSLSFNFLYTVFQRQKVFKFSEIPFINVFLLWFAHFYPNSKSQRFFSMLILQILKC